jgi:transcriptional regulator with XRE-family HTH domain
MDGTAISGWTVKVLREVRGWTREDLANATGLDPSTLSDYENEVTAPRKDTLVKVRLAFHLSDDEAKAAEKFVRQLRTKMESREQDPSYPIGAVSPSWVAESPTWRQEAAEVVEEGSHFMGRFLRLLFDLLGTIAEAVVKRS